MDISQNQSDFFHSQGYLKIEGLVPAGLVARLQRLMQGLIQKPDPDQDQAVLESAGVRYVTTVNDICNKGDLSALALLGLPAVLGTAEYFCGTDFVPIQDFVVIKNRGDNNPVLWHQDMLHGRHGMALQMGIYLDPADADDGALCVVPGSHLSSMDICGLRNQPSLQIPMRPGDVLLHDMMLAHCSGLLNHNTTRSVMYIEFLSAELLQGHRVYPDWVIEQRTRLIPVAVECYRQTYPHQPAFPWSHTNAAAYTQNLNAEQALQEIYAKPFGGYASAYCLEQMATKM